MFFPLLQRFDTLFHLFYILWGLFLVEPILWYYQIVLSSATKICYFFSFILRIIRSISYRTGAISSLISFFACYKYYLHYFIIYILWGLFLVEPILFYYQIVLSSSTKITSLFRIFHISCGLFLAELSLFYYQIVLSSATKIYLYDAFILLLIRTISCRTSSILLSNCYFRYYKDFLLYFIFFTSYEVYF